jgi:hypothetical protein
MAEIGICIFIGKGCGGRAAMRPIQIACCGDAGDPPTRAVRELYIESAHSMSTLTRALDQVQGIEVHLDAPVAAPFSRCLSVVCRRGADKINHFRIHSNAAAGPGIGELS